MCKIHNTTIQNKNDDKSMTDQDKQTKLVETNAQHIIKYTTANKK